MTWAAMVWCAGCAAVAASAGCGNDRPAATHSPGSPPQLPATPTTPWAGAIAGAVGVRIDAAAPTAGARTAQVSVFDGNAATVDVSRAGQLEFTLTATSPTAVITLGPQHGTGSLTVSLPVPTVELATLTLTSDGPLVPPLRLPVTVDNLAGDLVIGHGPVAREFDRVRSAPLTWAGESAATSTGVIDFVDGVAYYQGAAGPLSNARYLAFATAVVGPTVPCDGVDRPSIELDLTVVDRFAGQVAGKQRFRPPSACPAASFTVAPSAVRRWLRTQFVRDGN